MIITQILILFGLMAIGFIANKRGILDESSDRSFSKLIINIAIPATIISSSIGQNMDNKMEAMTVFAVAMAVFIITPIFGRFFVKKLKMNKTYEIMLVYSNLGFMGIPIISSIYGESAIFYVSIYMMLFNISLFSYGISIIQKDDASRVGIFKNLINPGIISAILGLVIFILDIPVPLPLVKLLATIGSVTTPLAMIVIGSTLAAVSIRDVIKDKTLYQFTFLKIVLIPGVLWFILQFFIQDAMILGIAVILTSLPTAGNVSMLCLEYDADVELVTKGIFMSTIFSLVTIPVLLFLF
ncbi:AEC family transporter [Paenibacillus sp. FSL H7-0943]|jgi:predicted permease|uniref:AEC family transporter n=1 Tax=Paenibacillus sp. FSL H7-0943 TaxID=2954739 RepID=UPI0030D1A9F7